MEVAMAARFEEASDAGDEHEPGSKPNLPASQPHSDSGFIDMTEVDEGRAFGFFVNPPPRSTPHALVPSPGGNSGAVVGSAEPDVIQQALAVLESRMRVVGPLLSNPQAVRDYLRLRF